MSISKEVKGAVVAGLIGAVVGAGTVFSSPVAEAWWKERKEFKFELQAPRTNEAVSKSKGFIASGTAVGLGEDETLWLLDRDEDGFYVDTAASVADQEWKAVDRPLGDDSDALPFELTFVVVRATPACSDALVNAADGFLVELPSGCALLESRSVIVAKK